MYVHSMSAHLIMLMLVLNSGSVVGVLPIASQLYTRSKSMHLQHTAKKFPAQFC